MSKLNGPVGTSGPLTLTIKGISTLDDGVIRGIATPEVVVESDVIAASWVVVAVEVVVGTRWTPGGGGGATKSSAGVVVAETP